MAKACGVQKAYLSRVLKYKGNLSLDQVYLSCDFLKLKPMEVDYIISLYHFENTTIEKRKKQLINEINEMKRKALRTEAHLNLADNSTVTQDNQKDLSIFYSDPNFSLIHMFLTLKKYSREPMLLRNILPIEKEKLNFYLDQLVLMGFVEETNDGWKILRHSVHLSESSYLIKAHRTFMRLKSLEKIDSLSQSDFHSVSILFSTDIEVHRKIREKFFQFLTEVEKMVQKSEEVEVYQLNFDLLKWS